MRSDCGAQENWTPLHRACKQQRINMALFLVQHGASVNALNDVRQHNTTNQSLSLSLRY
jgi:ankyrin repeat protein